MTPTAFLLLPIALAFIGLTIRDILRDGLRGRVGGPQNCLIPTKGATGAGRTRSYQAVRRLSPARRNPVGGRAASGNAP